MKYLIIALGILVTTQIQSQDVRSTKELPAEVVEAIEKRIANDYLPSIAIALIDSTGTYYFNFGKTEADGSKVDQNTVYEIGSISKVFTGILLAQQVLDNDLSMEDKINDLLPDGLVVLVKGDNKITLGNLTDHTSGLPRMPNNITPANPNNPYADYTVSQMYAFIANYQPIREVGSQYEYSNLAQGLLGHLLAMNKNTSYEKLMIAYIAEPLGMYDTRIELSERMKEHLALGHRRGQVVDNWDIPTLAGAGAIRSSTSDMAKFISANLGYVHSPITEAMNLSHEIRHDKAGGMSVAMGWHIKKGKDHDIYWHNGATGGYTSFAGFVKEKGIGVVLLTNSSQSSDDIGFHLLDASAPLANPNFKSDAIKLAESTLSNYIGVYELSPDFKISVTKEGQQLFIQATGQDRFEIYPETESLFFLTVVEAKVSFELKDGIVESLTLLQGGQKIPGKKIK